MIPVEREAQPTCDVYVFDRWAMLDGLDTMFQTKEEC